LKLGVGILAFSGLEFLKPSLQQIRRFVYRITVVYSPVSYLGDKAAPFVLPLLEQLKKEGWIDWIIFSDIRPVDKINHCQGAAQYQYNLAKKDCLKNNCTHFLAMDSDELFEGKQFQAVLAEVEKEALTICHLYDYVGRPVYRARGVSKLCVPFIHRIECPLGWKEYPVLIDASRMVCSDTYRILPKERIVMHHMTAVRYNEREFWRKFQGHACFAGKSQKEKEEYVQKYLNFQGGEGYETVLDIFGIETYWSKEFALFYKGFFDGNTAKGS